MNAITFHGVSDVRAQDVPEPRLVDPTDVVLRITTSAVCGSDLHQYHGRGGGALVQTGVPIFKHADVYGFRGENGKPLDAKELPAAQALATLAPCFADIRTD